MPTEYALVTYKYNWWGWEIEGYREWIEICMN